MTSENQDKLYAGIGARETPHDVCQNITIIARALAERGWKLRSGHALGADQAFELGTLNREIHLPWNGYNGGQAGRPTFIVPEFTSQVVELAARFHPTWHSLTDIVKKFMCRNATLLMGTNLDQPVEMVICWTRHGLVMGGTGHGIRIAHAHGIPIFNLANPEDWEKLDAFANRAR